MRQTRGWNGLRTAVVALGLFAWTSSGAEASALVTYQTSGNVKFDSGVTGDNVINFNSVSKVADAANPGTFIIPGFISPSSFSLGEFQVAPLDEGKITTYVNTPFSINYIPIDEGTGTAVSESKPTPITGVLNGEVTGADRSTVVATFNSATIPDFVTGLNTNKLSINDTSLSLVPSTSNGGRTTAQAYLESTPSATPIPEPTTIALFLTTLAGLGLRHRVRVGRAA